MTALYIVLGAVALIGIWLIAVYNGLIATKNRTDEAWSDIDVQLKRRYDLIPNLVESVKGYVKQEKEVLENVTKARAEAISAGEKGNTKDLEKAENMLTGALRSIFAVAENYPDLKSSANFQQLSTELSDTENKIMAARRFYNANVRDLNTKIQVFPTNLFAGMLGFMKREFFEAEEGSKENINVSF